MRIHEIAWKYCPSSVELASFYPLPVFERLVQALGKWSFMALMHIAHVAEHASPHADDEVPVTLAQCSHPVQVVADGLHPWSNAAAALGPASSPQLGLDA